MTITDLNITKLYKCRYVHPKTGKILKGCTYLEKKIKKNGKRVYLINGEWVPRDHVPEYREYVRKNSSSLKGFIRHIKLKIVERQKLLTKKGKFLIGNNEFEDEHGCYDKLEAHYDEQIDRYGPICPITQREFTFIRNNEKTGYGGAPRIMTNLSHDRLLNEQNYTKQNLLFTSAGWNLTRGNLSTEDMSFYMPKDFFYRYMEILRERFPDQKYKFNELENRAEHPQWRR